MFGRRKTATIPPEEKRQLEQVKNRLDRVERRMGVVETQLRVMRRDAK